MRYRYLLLLAALAASGCDGSDTPTSESTFNNELARQQAEAKLEDINTKIDDQTKPPDDAPQQLLTIETDVKDKTTVGRQLADEIQAARDSLAKLKANGGTTGEIAIAAEVLKNLEDKARLRADDLIKTGKIRHAVDMLQIAGLEDEAFTLAAPQDHAVDDKNVYKTSQGDTLDRDLVDETPATKRHEMEIGGQTFKFTASSGHLMAYAPKDPDNPNKPLDPQAAIFYTSYTRDNLPLDKRPVTFFFNGGPGSASIWLHMGALAPWRLDTGNPRVAEGAENGPPDDFPRVENRESLLDKSDLVFIDPPGTGHSVAITAYDKSDPAHPKVVTSHTNKDFWGVMSDARLMQDFVTRYINEHNRQSSPKYLFGESYGAGVRVPILSDLLLNAKGSRYEPDPSGKPPIYLSGSILLSPSLDMSSNCTQIPAKDTCPAWLPTFAMIADYHKKGKMRGNLTVANFIDKAKKYVDDIYLPAFDAVKAKKWNGFLTENPAFSTDMEKYTGLESSVWKKGPAKSVRGFKFELLQNYQLNIYDGRMKISSSAMYNFDYYEHTGFHKAFAEFLPEHIGYTNSSYYTHLNSDAGTIWDWNRGKGQLRATTTAVPEVQDGLRVDPSWKIMVAHGLYDLVTPFYPTELDLRKVQLEKRIPLKTYEGGHMLYYQESSRKEFKEDLVKFYDAPPYSAPPVNKTPSVSSMVVN